jgi:preprotein translocase subunit YajC
VNATSLVQLVLILGAFYLLILRPARTRQRQQLELRRQVEPGVTIMTTSGMFGTVIEVDDDSVHLEIAPGTVVRFNKAAIGRVVPEAEDEATDDDDVDYETDHGGEGHDGLGADHQGGAGSAGATSAVEPPDADDEHPNGSRDRAAG